MSRRPKVIKKLCTGPPEDLKASDDGVTEEEYFDNNLDEIVFDTSDLKDDPVVMEKRSGLSSDASAATTEALAEIHKLISDSFMFMHEKLQGLEELVVNLQKTVDARESSRKVDHASLKVRLGAIEKYQQKIEQAMKRKGISMSGGGGGGVGESSKPKGPLLVVTDSEASATELNQPEDTSRLQEPSLFPLKTNEAMERLAKDAEANPNLKKSLREMFLFGRSTPEVTIRNWISDEVLAQYSTTVNSSKLCISESRFISQIQDAWLSEKFTIEDFESLFEKILEDINQKRQVKKIKLSE